MFQKIQVVISMQFRINFFEMDRINAGSVATHVMDIPATEVFDKQCCHEPVNTPSASAKFDVGISILVGGTRPNPTRSFGFNFRENPRDYFGV